MSIGARPDGPTEYLLMAARVIVREVFAKSVLSNSRIQDYTINAYVGCSHACRYCYAAFMKRFTGHSEKWGEFVDVKINAPAVLGEADRQAEKGKGLGERCLRSVSESGEKVWANTSVHRDPR